VEVEGPPGRFDERAHTCQLGGEFLGHMNPDL
jgi:hypothetical protein